MLLPIGCVGGGWFGRWFGGQARWVFLVASVDMVGLESRRLWARFSGTDGRTGLPYALPQEGSRGRGAGGSVFATGSR